MHVRAFAKINLSLRVLGRRADGYHDLRTIFQSIALHDTLAIRRERGPFRVTCTDPRVPVDRRNLVWRAAHGVWKATGRRGVPRGISIDLIKRIPLEGGLGGGSSDAAAALRALGGIWRATPAQILAVASSLGADVPYFLEGGTVLGLDRGDLLFPLMDYPKAWVVVVAPAFGVSTAEAYGWFDSDVRKKSTVVSAFRRTVSGPAEAGHYVRSGFSTGGSRFFNDLQGPVAARHPEIARNVSGLRRAGASYAGMSGSGSAVFGLFDNQALARDALRRLSTRTRNAIVTRTLTRAEYRRLAAK